MRKTYAKTKDAIGKVLSHDITRIVRGKCKGPAFKKGHVIREEDIPLLLDIGKEHVYFLELDADELHEDDAGLVLASAVAGEGLVMEGPSEGKVDLIASQPGLLKVDVQRLYKINQLPHVIMATLHTNSPVKKGDRVAGTRIIPLAVKEEILDEAKKIGSAGEPLIRVLGYQPCKMGCLITGREVYDGRVEDAFTPVLREKAQAYGLAEPLIDYAPDDAATIAVKINMLLEQDCDLVVVTGGMSVDPDDVTPAGIRLSGAVVEKYGAPVLPGAMFLLAYRGRVPVVGLPACGMFFQTTVFDLMMPRLLVGERIGAADIAALGHGGFCRRCEQCLYPDCSFGKGGFLTGS